MKFLTNMTDYEEQLQEKYDAIDKERAIEESNRQWHKWFKQSAEDYANREANIVIDDYDYQMDIDTELSLIKQDLTQD